MGKKVQSVINLENVKQIKNKCGQCYLAFEQYQLRSHLANTIYSDDEQLKISKKFIEKGKLKYEKIVQKLEHCVQQVKIILKYARANELKVLNNAFKLNSKIIYKKSQNLLDPFAFQKEKQAFLQKIILEEQIKVQQINQIMQKIEEKQVQNTFTNTRKQNRPQNESEIMKIIDQTLIHLYSYYDAFQRTIFGTRNYLENSLELLNRYHDVLDNTYSLQILDLKTEKQNQVESIIKQYQRLMGSQYSTEKIDGMKKKRQKIKENEGNYFDFKQEQNKLKTNTKSQVGNMSNKKQPKLGILNIKKNQINLLNWYFDLKGEKKEISSQRLIDWRVFYEKKKQLLTDYELSLIQSVTQTQNNKIQEISNRSYPSKKDVFKSLHHFDQFGSNQAFSLIDYIPNIIQRRIQFEAYLQEQIEEEWRKKKAIFKINHSQALRILEERFYGRPKLEKKYQFHEIDLSQIKLQNLYKMMNIDLQYLKVAQVNKKQTIIQNQKKEGFIKKKSINNESSKTLFEQVSICFFGQIQSKYRRLVKNEKPIKTLYFSSIQKIDFNFTNNKQNSVKNFLSQIERMFLIFPKLLMSVQKFYSLNSQKLRCVIYMVHSELKSLQKDLLKEKIKQAYKDQSLIITFKFEKINCDLFQIPSSQTEKQLSNCQKYILGVLYVLVYENILSGSYKIQDYLNKGSEILQEFNGFKSGEAQIKYPQNPFKKIEKKNHAKINYVFESQSTEGIQFTKLAQAESRLKLQNKKWNDSSIDHHEQPISWDQLQEEMISQNRQKDYLQVQVKQSTDFMFVEPKFKRVNSRQQLLAVNINQDLVELDIEQNHKNSVEDDDYIDL